MVCTKYITLNNGLTMPALGLGTWQASYDEVTIAINQALEAGYRHIDTAPVYLNEKAIGSVLKEWLDEEKVTRDELFIVTKLPPTANRAQEVEDTLRNSLADLKLDFVDLYLVHTPFTINFADGDFERNENGDIVLDTSTNHAAVWKVMEEMVQIGLTKSIGLSNFNKQQIERLLKNCSIRPACLQIEHHIYLQQRDLVDYCKEQNISVVAYSPLGSKGITVLNKMAGIDRELPDLMEVPEVKVIAESHGKTPAQILLRWILDCGVSAIPKSTNPIRLIQNLDIFDFQLSEPDVQLLCSLDANIRVCDFKFFKGVDKHPEFPF